MEKDYSIGEAKNKLPAIIHTVERGPRVRLTRYGKPVAILMSIHEYNSLVNKKKSFWDAYKSFQAMFEKEDINIPGKYFEGIRDQSTGREIEL